MVEFKKKNKKMYKSYLKTYSGICLQLQMKKK